MSDKPNPRQILKDLQSELTKSLLEDTFETESPEGIKTTWTMRLLNEDEITWSFSKTGMDLKNLISMGISFRLPTLAIGIRRMNETSILEVFQEDWDLLTETEQENLMNSPGASLDKLGAEFLLDYLKKQPSEFVNELWVHWQSLEARRKEGQQALKKSSGESGDLEEKTSSPDSTPTGA